MSLNPRPADDLPADDKIDLSEWLQQRDEDARLTIDRQVTSKRRAAQAPEPLQEIAPLDTSPPRIPNVNSRGQHYEIETPDDMPNYSLIAEIVQKVSYQQKHLKESPAPGIKPIRDRLELADLRKIHDTVEELYKRTALERIDDGMSRVQVSELLGVHQSTVSRWVKDNKQD